MIVEDDSALLRIECDVLSRSGFDVIPFSDPRRAYESLARGTAGVGVVLLDLWMPGLTGYEFLQSMRREPALMRIPVVVTTGAPPDADRLRGAFATLLKPFTCDALVRIAEAAFRERDIVAVRPVRASTAFPAG